MDRGANEVLALSLSCVRYGTSHNWLNSSLVIFSSIFLILTVFSLFFWNEDLIVPGGVKIKNHHDGF